MSDVIGVSRNSSINSANVKLSYSQWIKSKLKTTPQKFRAIQIMGVFIAFLIFVVVGLYASHLKNLQQVISRDTVPSIIAAEKLRYHLSNAHAELINMFLLKKVDAKSSEQNNSWNAYKENIKKAQSSYLDAAQNITYGEAERKPIYDVMTGLNEYERLIGAARLSGKYGEEVEEANSIMQKTILPATIELDKANYDILNNQYKHFKDTKFIYMGGVFLFFIFVVAYLYFSQKYLFAKTKRKFNLGMLSSSLVTILGFLGVIILTNTTNSFLHVAKDDAFDSIHLMWKAKATGSEINFTESLYLLESANKDKQNILLNEFDKKAQIEMKYLLDENKNVTFQGEGVAAKNAMNYFQSYTKIDRTIREYETLGRHGEAINLCIGTKEGESNYVFDQFDRSLDSVLDINSKEFDSHVKSALTNIYILDFLGFVMAIIFGVAVFLGIKPRIEEYKY
ncbi:MAG: hypothetical protein H7263_19260 [Candidatus Sericytochromatia bacterium]|nr:hypothetical protein [Candidatus Sericytochromatia bacterium]